MLYYHFFKKKRTISRAMGKTVTKRIHSQVERWRNQTFAFCMLISYENTYLQDGLWRVRNKSSRGLAQDPLPHIAISLFTHKVFRIVFLQTALANISSILFIICWIIETYSNKFQFESLLNTWCLALYVLFKIHNTAMKQILSESHFINEKTETKHVIG